MRTSGKFLLLVLGSTVVGGFGVVSCGGGGGSGDDGDAGTGGSATDASMGSGGSGATGGSTGTGGSGGSGGGAGSGTGGSGGSGGSGGGAGSGMGGSGGTAGGGGSSGAAGVAGDGGSSGMAGTSGSSGAAGAAGTGGSSGAAGASGSSGAAGASGSSGAAGASGSSGAAGASGSSGAAGAAGNGGVDCDGYFVLTSRTYISNLGGLVGADAKCLDDLQTNDWRGKETLTFTANVKAWLCGTTTCSTLTPNRTYCFARSGDATVGGASFVTDGAGLGPGNDDAWDDASHFGVPTAPESEYWSNRKGLTTDPNFYFSNEPRDDVGTSGNMSCDDWTQNTGGFGTWAAHGSPWTSGSLAVRRYAGDGVNFCSGAGPKRLVCIVDP